MNSNYCEGKVWRRIVSQAVPLTLAEIVHLMYNIVDRIYLGHLSSTDSMALTGIGLVFPIVTLISAFTALYGTGGTPLFSISRGAGEVERARRIQGSVFTLLLGTSIVLMALSYLFMKPILFAFGASEQSYAYADAYLKIYLIGTPFIMISTGLNGFINAQGFPKMGMLTTVIGAALNLVLDPLFIFVLGMGVRGAAAATVISQFVSFVWVMQFITGRKALLPLERRYMGLKGAPLKEILSLGAVGFIMKATNSLVQIVCNKTLSIYGGDMYVSIMTVLNSVREMLSLPLMGITSGAQPVLGYNYGAKEYDRVKQGIRFTAATAIVYTVAMWIFVLVSAGFLVSMFSTDPAILEPGMAALKMYFFGFCFMALQSAGQSTFQALGYARYAIFFSLLRKAIIVVPLTLLLPAVGFGTDGVFMAEPVSNLLGGTASFVTMLMVVYRKLGKDPQTGAVHGGNKTK